MRLATKVIATTILALLLTLATVSAAFGAQGQITEVNPSGVVGNTVRVTPPNAKGIIVDVNPSVAVKASPAKNKQSTSFEAGTD